MGHKAVSRLMCPLVSTVVRVFRSVLLSTFRSFLRVCGFFIVWRHIYLCASQHFSDGQYLDARIPLVSSGRFVVARAGRLGLCGRHAAGFGPPGAGSGPPGFGLGSSAVFRLVSMGVTSGREFGPPGRGLGPPGLSLPDRLFMLQCE
ncbi:MAG TPA: hypothetical protein VNG51_10315 [Ktedonobacteraceae bacterium]|nr:hypothetical protein [Ktedonobacteraceae bacterium]